MLSPRVREFNPRIGLFAPASCSSRKCRGANLPLRPAFSSETETSPAARDRRTIACMGSGSLATFASIVCVDWGKEHAKRCAWVADVATRTIAPLDLTILTLPAILDAAGARPG